MPCPPSRTRRATRSSAAWGDGSHRYTSVSRQPSALHLRNMGRWVRPAQVVSNAKLTRFLMSSLILCSISRPAPNAACSGLNGDSPRAISSAFTNSRISRPCGTSNCAAVVFPAPLGPLMMTISSTCSESLSAIACAEIGCRETSGHRIGDLSHVTSGVAGSNIG